MDLPSKLRGLDLFSGIGGITLALSPWVRPVAYCEIDRYASAVLLSQMQRGNLPTAPIWDDVRTLRSDMLPEIDIIYGGFPCQDISCAGRGAGLEGERSGLFFEIMRLVDEVRPSFIFLENVPAIVTRGLDRVIGEISGRGYDARWITLSAQDVGANHGRKRWWLLAYAESARGGRLHARPGAEGKGAPDTKRNGEVMADSDGNRRWQRADKSERQSGSRGTSDACTRSQELADAACQRRRQGRENLGGGNEGEGTAQERDRSAIGGEIFSRDYWAVES